MQNAKGMIYVQRDDWDMFLTVRDKDYYGRYEMIDNYNKTTEELKSDPGLRPGYFLRRNLHLGPVPVEMDVAGELKGEVDPSVSTVIFSNAPNLPPLFKESVMYWSDRPEMQDMGVVHYQNPQHEYMIRLAEDDDEEHVLASASDFLLTEGVVAKVDITYDVAEMNADSFIDVSIPLDVAGLLECEHDSEGFMFNNTVNSCIQISLRVGDIQNAPDPKLLYIDLYNHEMLDYGYYY